MRKNIFIILLSAIVVSCFYGCSSSEIPTWNATARVWFTSTDTTYYSFALYPDSTSKIVELPLSIAGYTASYDRSVSVSVVSPFRNDTTKYQIISPVVIPKDSTSGSLRVRVYQTANLNNKRDTITFALSNSSDLQVGLSGYLKKTLVVYNKAVKPSWWTTYETYTLGRYTEKKLNIIYIVLGSITTDPLSDSKKSALNLYKLDQYLSEYGPFYDYDGMLIQFQYGY